MCGIVGGFLPQSQIERGIQALLHRGPDAQGIITKGNISLGHTRLAILDLDPRSNQPFIYGSTTLVFNGEIWNYQQIRRELQGQGYIFTTTGDTEVVAALLDYYQDTPQKALNRLDGMFALAWTYDGFVLYLARDRFGEIPLHLAKQKNKVCFASEHKALLVLGIHPQAIIDIEPGTYQKVTSQGFQAFVYYDAPIKAVYTQKSTAQKRLYGFLRDGVRERLIADVPICTLLSGGIDSSIIAYFLHEAVGNKRCIAYTAVYNSHSQDVKNARLLAQLLRIELREVAVPVPTPDNLSEVIACIEMDYKAQIEIGWPCLKLAQAMKQDGFKVTFSGEGSDELWASYGFSYHALQTQDWHVYRKELFLSQARKNFVRCNKIFMHHGIECRLPFLHMPLVEYALSLPQNIVQNGKSRPKALLQDAFSGVLPGSIVKRPKVAFQDGMGIKEAIAKVLPSPEKYYRAEYRRLYA